MVNRLAKLTAAEITRTAKAAQAAGIHVGRIEADHLTGKVTIYAKDGTEAHFQPVASDARKDEIECDRLFGLAS